MNAGWETNRRGRMILGFCWLDEAYVQGRDFFACVSGTGLSYHFLLHHDNGAAYKVIMHDYWR